MSGPDTHEFIAASPIGSVPPALRVWCNCGYTEDRALLSAEGCRHERRAPVRAGFGYHCLRCGEYALVARR